MTTDDTEAQLLAFFGDADLFEGKPDKLGNDHGAWAASERADVRAVALASFAGRLGGELDALLDRLDLLREEYEASRAEAANMIDTIGAALGLAEALAQRSGHRDRLEGEADREAQVARLKKHHGKSTEGRGREASDASGRAPRARSASRDPRERRVAADGEERDRGTGKGQGRISPR